MLTRLIKQNIINNNNSRIIYYDLETTGFNCYHHDIIEIGALDNYNNQFNELIKINKPLPPKITKITNITDKLLNTQGKERKNVFKQFINYLNIYSEVVDNIYLVAHNNNSFDMLFLKYQFKKYNLILPENIKFIDSCKLAQLILPFRKSHSMNSLCEYFNLNNNNAHRAFADVIYLKKIYKILLIFFKNKYNNSKPDFIIYKLNNPY